MINNKEKIKAKMKEELYRAVDKFVDEMDAESNKEQFPIEVLEDLLGNIIEDSKKIIVDKTDELIDGIEEEAEISKKKHNI